MSVPLDRLYNFLHDVCNHRDLIIYRFFPHGSRKLEDLTRLVTGHQTDLQPINYQNDSLSKYVFYNDQEPLNFDLYKDVDVTQLPHIKMHTSGFDSDHLKKYHAVAEKTMPYMNLKWAHGLGLCKYPTILVHSEKRSAELERYEDIQFIGVYWWCHALIAQDWFRYAKIDPALNHKDIKHDFLIYNRAWSGTREYRIKFIELVVEHSLNNHCVSWFNEFDNGRHYLDHVFVNSKFASKNTQLSQVFAASQANSSSSADYTNIDYQTTAIEVVLETLFDDSRLHLTEKILRPIACGQPFILAATQGSLEYLRSYGFGTFDGLIDETYDTILDPLERLQAIVIEMKRIAQLSQKDKHKLYTELEQIASKNKQLFFSTEWQQKIIKEYEYNFESALKKLNAVLQVNSF
jgi:hypothetical protein